MEVGHIAEVCEGPDRRGRCYVCSGLSHQAARCATRTLKCPLCADLRRPDGHVLRAVGCAPPCRWWGRAPKKKERRDSREGHVSSSDMEENGTAMLCPSDEGEGRGVRAARGTASFSIATPSRPAVASGGTAGVGRGERRWPVAVEKRVGEGGRAKEDPALTATREEDGATGGPTKRGSYAPPTLGSGQRLPTPILGKKGSSGVKGATFKGSPLSRPGGVGNPGGPPEVSPGGSGSAEWEDDGGPSRRD